MTTESNDIDSRVADAYRDLASEKTPPELDRTILSMAAGTQRSPYGKARAWVRPAAWAATIGLSLAFVLELSQVTDKAPLSGGGSDGDTFEVLEERVASDDAAATAKSDSAVRQEREKRSDNPGVTNLSAPPATPAPTLDGDSASSDFEVDDMNLLQEAEERARLHSGESRPAARAAEYSALAETKEQVDSCDADARSSAEAWFACIEALRESGLSDVAAEELEALRAEYPDFQEPTPSR
ncbi:MAG: hypothetical protein EX272_14260 [Chromatiales bacterium]|nr:MAG: hypothetical protein EX272_14260 [Chromatiales bacterium]